MTSNELAKSEVLRWAEDHELRSFQEAKRLLGYKRGWRTLLRRLEAVELARKVRFIDRTKKRGLTRVRVSMAAILCHDPGLLGKGPSRVSDHIGVRQAQEFLETVEELAADQAEEYISRRVVPKLDRIGERLVAVEKRLGIR